jgi:pimeloyl-ACP methyl ester carboxylesterase
MGADLFFALGVAAAASVGWVVFWIGFTHWRFARYHRKKGLPYPPLGVAGWARFYLATVASVGRLAWWGVRALLADGLRVPPGSGLPAGERGRPVLCVHGFHLSGSSMWGIRRVLERRGRPTRAVSLGLPHRSAESYARVLVARMERLLAERPDDGVDVVAHSMGGLILRLVLSRHPHLAASVRRIVTLGSPHHGTALLRTIRFGAAYRMMSRGAPFLQTLPTFEESAPEAVVTTVASTHDLVVYPMPTAHLPGARQITLERVGHLGLLTDCRVQELVAERLGATRSNF